jgi:hypothetical protein
MSLSDKYCYRKTSKSSQISWRSLLSVQTANIVRPSGQKFTSTALNTRDSLWATKEKAREFCIRKTAKSTLESERETLCMGMEFMCSVTVSDTKGRSKWV